MKVMDYELREELKTIIENSLEQKRNPNDALLTLLSLIEFITDFYLGE